MEKAWQKLPSVSIPDGSLFFHEKRKVTKRKAVCRAPVLPGLDRRFFGKSLAKTPVCIDSGWEFIFSREKKSNQKKNGMSRSGSTGD
ncbi:MAG: hypothetical protein IKC82_01210 [Lentisphaeria bacterium]|nr:hypothetical protein [Lentisphaeria bacterium]